MCGIVGFYSAEGSSFQQTLQRMTNALQHRGPDSDGHWVDEEAGIALGHRRLAIVDLSPSGSQPMETASGRYIIIFNGEIFNFQTIRKELEGYGVTFRGTSDTEVLLEAVERWGVKEAIQKFVGQFAFALWDKQERTLYLTRDRMGEKPLYYGWMGDALLFGSELVSLQQHPNWQGVVNRDAVALLMRHNYIPAPHSIYENIYKLPPASLLTIRDFRPGNLPEPELYWSIKSAAEAWQSSPFVGSDQDAIDELERLLKDAVRDQMIADVPLGAFLSGGIDSSTIVALMQTQSSRPVRTFSIGFHEADYNEAPYAKDVANHLGTDHTEVYLTPQDALGVIPLLPDLYDEPFADPSQIPTYLVSKVARQHVTVALSGDAGDELFAGYRRYFRTQQAYDKLQRVPLWAQQLSAKTLLAVPDPAWNMVHSLARKAAPNAHHVPSQKLYKWLKRFPIEEPQSLYHMQFSHTATPTQVVIGSAEAQTAFTDKSRWAEVSDIFHHMTYLDMIAYLPDDVLVKVDRASMGVSLEVRVPLLNHHIVEFASRIPVSMKVRDGQGKWILRQLLYRYVPREIVDRPKMGFGIPMDRWLRHDLKDWAEALIAEDRLKREGFLDAAHVRQVWDEHQSGKVDHQYYLWNILMFQAWLSK